MPETPLKLVPASQIDRDELLGVMCDAYCQKGIGGGGPKRYRKAMGRVLKAIEDAGYEIRPPAEFNDWGRVG